MNESETRYRNARVLVVGASGFIGRWVSRALASCGAQLQLAVRDVARARRVADVYGFRGEFHELADADAAAALVARCAPDVVFNLAGYGVDPAQRDSDRAARINSELPERLARALVPASGRARSVLVHVGSALEYGEVSGNLAEASTPQPTTLYGETKLAGTLAVGRVCAAHRIPGLTARLFTVFGPGEHPGRLFPTLLESARSSGPVALTAGTQRRDFCFVGDVATGLLKLGASEVEPGEVVNLACGTLTPVRTFVETAARALGIAPGRLDFGAIATRSEEMQHDPVSIGRLIELTGWKPSADLADAIARALRFARANARLSAGSEG